MKVLVTGGAGLLGMAVRERLLADGHTVLATDIADFGRNDPDLILMDLSDIHGIEALVVQNTVDSIVHCGAISGPMLAKNQPMRLVDVNIGATAALLDIARRHGLNRFVFCSSISVYGNVGGATIVEDTPLHPTSVYGATKVSGEALVEAFAAEYGLEGASLRIGRVYGPYRRANCHLGTMIRNAIAGRGTEIPCDPEFKYHYVHVDDVASAIASVLTARSLPSRVYNVGSGEGLTMPEIADRARTVLPDARIELVEGSDDVPDVQTVFAIDRIRHELGWEPRYDLAAGLAAYRTAIEEGRAALS